MTDEDTCPSWDALIPRRQFEKVVNASVTAIRLCRRMTSEDGSETWISLTLNDDKGTIVDVKHEHFWLYFQFTTCPTPSLLVLTPRTGRDAQKRLLAIRAWEERNAEELAEYQRLRKKFSHLD